MKKEPRRPEPAVEAPNLFDIDPNHLDWEWQNHSRIYYQVATKLADASDELERAEARLKVVDAELLIAISNDPKDYGLKKSTVDVIKAAVIVHPDHAKAQERVFVKKHKVAIFQVEEKTLNRKQKALEKGVELELNNLWSEPRAPKSVLGPKRRAKPYNPPREESEE
jgi:hypothetical protein